MKTFSKHFGRIAMAIFLLVLIGGAVFSLTRLDQIKAFFLQASSASEDANQDDPHAGHSHAGDGESTVATTIWAEEIDIFLERPYAIVGEPNEMLVHATVMSNGAAIVEGSLTVKVIGPDQSEFEVSVDSPARAGIFIPEIIYQVKGVHRVSLVIDSPQIEAGSETIELPHVVVFADDHVASHVAEEEAEDEPNDLISYLKEQQWRVDLTTVEAVEMELGDYFSAPGIVIAPPGAGAVVSAPITGIVRPPENGSLPMIGEAVTEGQILGWIEPTIGGADAIGMLASRAELQSLEADIAIKLLNLETDIRNAEVGLSLAQDVFERTSELVESRISPGKDLTQAQHDLSVAEERLNGLTELRPLYEDTREELSSVLNTMQGQSRGDGEGPEGMLVPLRSPISGSIVEVVASPGEQMAASQAIFHVLNIDTLWIEANVSEYDLGKVREAAGADFRLAAYPDQTFSVVDNGGSLVNIGARLDPESRTIPVRYQVDNAEGLLRVGMYAELLIETGDQRMQVAVPRNAVQEESGEMVVYVHVSGEAFQRRHVRVGNQNAQYVAVFDSGVVAVSDGVLPGERVVNHAAYSVRLATLSDPVIGHGHAH